MKTCLYCTKKTSRDLCRKCEEWKAKQVWEKEFARLQTIAMSFTALAETKKGGFQYGTQ